MEYASLPIPALPDQLAMSCLIGTLVLTWFMFLHKEHLTSMLCIDFISISCLNVHFKKQATHFLSGGPSPLQSIEINAGYQYMAVCYKSTTLATFGMHTRLYAPNRFLHLPLHTLMTSSIDDLEWCLVWFTGHWVHIA